MQRFRPVRVWAHRFPRVVQSQDKDIYLCFREQISKQPCDERELNRARIETEQGHNDTPTGQRSEHEAGTTFCIPTNLVLRLRHQISADMEQYKYSAGGAIASSSFPSLSERQKTAYQSEFQAQSHHKLRSYPRSQLKLMTKTDPQQRYESFIARNWVLSISGKWHQYVKQEYDPATVNHPYPYPRCPLWPWYPLVHYGGERPPAGSHARTVCFRKGWTGQRLQEEKARYDPSFAATRQVYTAEPW